MNVQPRFVRDPALLADRFPLLRSRRWWLVVGALLAAILLYFALRRPPPPPAAPEAPHVSVFVPGQRGVTSSVSATGTLAARREMPVGVSGEGGKVSGVLVDAGDWVRAGQVLAVIERSVQSQQASQLAAQVRVAEADAALSRTQLDRAQKLVARGFVSRADIDQKTATRDAAEARVRVARAQLGEVQARIGQLAVRAPAAGLVLERKVEPGQVVGAGSGTLFRIARGGEMELRAAVAQQDLPRLRPGMAATVTPIGSQRGFPGKLWLLSPVIDPATRQGEARIALGYDPALRPGGFASARITAGETQAPIVPESAVQSDAGGSFVLIVGRDGRALRRNVTIGEVSERGMAITSGLTGKEPVVLSAGAFLNPGEKIVPERVATPN